MKTGPKPKPLTPDLIERRSIPEPNSGCWLWMLGCYPSGYGKLWHDSSSEGAHRASWKAFNGQIPAGLCVLHRCDERTCVNPRHLFVGTFRDNTLDMMIKGRGRGTFESGDKHPFSVLTDSQVIEIRRASAAGASQTELAQRYRVRLNVVNRICRNRTRKHLLGSSPSSSLPSWSGSE